MRRTSRQNPPDNEGADEPRYHGHRERFYGPGPGALSNHELLEMALFAAIARRDTKALAKALLKNFGSFAEIVHAPIARLREVDASRITGSASPCTIIVGRGERASLNGMRQI